MGQKSSGLVPLCQLISGWLFYENSRISQRVSSTLSSPSMRSGSLINPNQIALSMSCSIRSKILWMVSSERYEVIFMIRFSPRGCQIRVSLKLGNQEQRFLRTFQKGFPTLQNWVRLFFPYLKNTKNSPRMGKICASSRIGFRLQKIQPPVWQLDDWTSYEIVVQIYAIINPNNHSIPYTQKDLILLFVLS